MAWGFTQRWCVLFIAAEYLVWAASAGTTRGRQAFSLDGTWKFSLHAPNAGDGDVLGPTMQTGTIQVPGSWEAQGFGSETVQMHNQVITGDNAKGTRGAVGVYTLSTEIPPCDDSQAKRVLTVDRGIHRHAIFKVGGNVVGEHMGYLTPFEAELSPLDVEDCCCGSSCDIEVTLDGGRNPQVDPLMGAVDDDTDGTNLGGWAGLNGHVAVECRPPVFIDGGTASQIPPHVTHPPVTTASAGHPLEISVDLEISGGKAVPKVEVVDAATNETVGTSTENTASQGNATVKVTIPAVKLWSPEDRNLYFAVVTIHSEAAEGLDDKDSVMDVVTTRFGVRTITTDGKYQFLLNGQRVFLAGYGDDAIYPLTVSPPRTKAPYEQKVKLAHELGFNFVRHHSGIGVGWEYFDAADEWGIMVSPELACVYSPYFKAANETGIELYIESWKSYIQVLRNHPSIFDWPMCNEYYMGPKLAPHFYDIAKQLDPSRLAMDSDGACNARSGSPTRKTLDFCSEQFDIGNIGAWGSIALDEGNKYHDVCSNTTHECQFAKPPTVPVISHETGNCAAATTSVLAACLCFAPAADNTFPRVTQLIKAFKESGTNIRPYWLSPSYDKLNATGLLDEEEKWAVASEHLYVLCWKLDVEDQRRNSMISGYEWWLIQDYWTGSNGVTDTFLKPKPGVVPYIKQFNARSIFLQDGLQLSYSSGDQLEVDISLSNFGDGALPTSAQLTWHVMLDGKSIKSSTVAVAQAVAQGSLGVVATVQYQLPDVGTTASVAFGEIDGPKTLTITAQFASSSGSFAAAVPLNSWNTTLFPKWVTSKTKHPIKVTSADLQASCGFSNCEVSNGEPSSDEPPAVYLTTGITGALVASVHKAGSVVVLVQDTSTGAFQSAATRFKQAWWLGSATDNNAGTLVYDNAAAILGGMAPDGYADQSWFHMINGAQTFLMGDSLTLPGEWSDTQNGTFGAKDSCQILVNNGCPPEFPFPIGKKGPCGPHCTGKICYKTKTEADAGEGPCGSWCTKDVNTGDGCGNNAARMCPSNCPADFPYPTHGPPPAKGVVCYKTQAEATAAEGPCGSWCTHAVNVGDGCGDNHQRLCAPPPHAKPSCHPSSDIKSCQADCDAVVGCNAVNFNASHGCCLVTCQSNSTAPPKKPKGSCCSAYRETGGSLPAESVKIMMRAIDVVGLSRNKALLWSAPLGNGTIIATGLKLIDPTTTQNNSSPGKAWVLDRLLRYGESLLPRISESAVVPSKKLS